VQWGVFLIVIGMIGLVPPGARAGELKAQSTTVAELFGFGPQERLLVIHADDAGMCHAHNRATIDGMQQGAINSASIMMPCPWIAEILEYSKANPDADFGVHATLNSEWKSYRWRTVAPWDQVKGLLDAQGYLHRGVMQTAASASGAEVETELRAQVRRAVDLGLKPTHLDTHMGTVYARPDYFAAYRKVANEFGLPCMIPRLTPQERQKLPLPLRLVAEQIGRTLFEAGEVTIDHLNGGYSGGGDLADQKKYYMDAIRNLQPGITQIIVHPAYDGDELGAITGSHARRNRDLRVFLDPTIAKLIRDQHVRLLTWREIGRRQAEYRKRPALPKE
jgi:predicted glycoside hydrolase/deacetylase ChbG (UPF0249 family)